MTRAWVAALALLAACHKPPATTASGESADAGRPEPASADAGAVVSIDAGANDADTAAAAEPGPPARALPTAPHLLAALKGTSARGFIAMTNAAETVFADFQSDVAADKPVLVASFTKLWTAIAVLRAVERSSFSLDDDIRTLLPDLKSKPWADSTVRELLGHVSRVPEFDDAGGYYSKSEPDFSNPVPVLAKYIGSGTEKRGVWKYRNSEFALLGAVLQAKSGTPVTDVLALDVWTPAGMTHAGLVIGKPPADVDFAPMGRVRPQNFFTAGAGYASANDLLAFFGALGAGKLLGADSQKLLFSGIPERNHGAFGCWAFPFPTSDGGTTLFVERPGGFGNVRLFTAFFPEERRAIVMWSGADVDVGRPRTKGTLAAKLAKLALE